MDMFFGRFNPLKKLGEGGFAEVWLAEDIIQKREVALKILKQMDEISKFRFKKEFHILNKLNNLGIVKAYDYLQNSHILYSMEFIKGKNIRDYLFSYAWADEEREGPFYIHRDGMEKAFEIFYQTSNTLHYIHNENIIHRDLKPENIFFDEEKKYVKVLDFGLVKEEEVSIQKTQKDMIQGTPAYISPEYIKGREIDFRADLYALGVIFYEILTGRLPFSSNSIMLLLEAHLKQTPTPPGVYNSLIPAEMEELILKLLEKEPQNRFNYAIEVAQKIKKISDEFKKGEEKRVIREEKTQLIEVKLPQQLLIAPWTGKKEEIRKVLLLIERLKLNKGGIFFIEGEHGSGKSRLLEEVKAKAVDEGLDIFSGLSKEEIPYPFYLFEKIIKEIFKKFKKVITEEAELILQFFPELQKEIEKDENLKTLPQIDPKGEKARLFYAFYSIVKKLSEEKPIIFLLDDLQWADPSSLELLNHLIYMLLLSENPKPVLFYLSFIGEEVSDESKSLLFKYKNKAENIILKPFNLEEIQEFVQALLSSPEPLPLSFLDILLSQTGGNPFFVMETIRALIDEGFLRRQTGKMNWIIASYKEAQRATMTLQKLALPETIKDNLKLRLRKYNEKEISILQGASLIGKKFPFILWHKISEIGEDELLNLAEKLLKDKILKELPNEILEFANDQIRKILIEDISELRKKKTQGKIANAILSFYKEVPEDLYFTLAQNLEASGRGEEAKFYYKKLGEKALKVYDLLQAEDLWNKVLNLSDENEKAQCLKILGDILTYSGRFDQAEDHYKEALIFLKQKNEDYYETNVALCSLYGQKGNFKEMEGKITEIYQEILEKDFKKPKGSLLYLMGVLNYHKGVQDKAIELFDQSLKIFEELNFVEGILSVYGTLGAPYLYSGRVQEAMEVLKKGLKLSDAYGDFRRKLICLSNLISININLGNFKEAKESLEEAIKLAQYIGDLRLYAHLLYTKGSVFKKMGLILEGKEFVEKAKNLSVEISAKEIYSYTLLNILSTQIEEENFKEAKENLDKVLKLCKEINLHILLPILNFLSLYLDFTEGKREVVPSIESAFEEMKKIGIPYDICEASIYFGKVLKLNNEEERAKKILEEALSLSEEKNFGYLSLKIKELLK